MQSVVWRMRTMAKSVVWRKKAGQTRVLVGTIALGLGSLVLPGAATPSWADSPPSRYIVANSNGSGSSLALTNVNSVGGQVLISLDAANAVLANLTSSEVAQLQALPDVVVTPDVMVSVQDTTASSTPGRAPAAVFPQETGATQLWAQGDEGAGVNVAVLDTGIDPLPDFAGRLIPGVDLSGEGNSLEDSYGHGTFVAGLIAGNGASSGGTYMGEAPAAGLVSVKVAGASGETDLATVIAGVGWTINNAASLNIGVLNMSLGFVPSESTTSNPLDQAVEKAWNAGIVVTTSAGNAGPFNGTILSPGDDPLVITAGALDDMGTTTTTDDSMTSFSSVGPTSPDGWLKPDLVTSGRSVVSLRAPGSTVDVQNPSAEVGTANFVGSGTSFSSAITAGAAALILSAHPNDAPNDVKASMLATTSPGPVGSPFVDGHGALNVAAAAADNGVHLSQSFGDVTISSPANLQINPGDPLSAGYVFSMPGKHPVATVQFVGADVTLAVACSAKGSTVGAITINLSGGPYSVPANAKGSIPTDNQHSPASFEGSTTAPDLCGGNTMFGASATFSAQVNSTDTADNVQVQFHSSDAAVNGNTGWSSSATVVPISPTAVGTTVSESVPWTLSTWNPGNWHGLPPTAPAPGQGQANGAINGLAWNGSDWNGLAWNHVAWNGLAWNHVAWNGLAWDGLAWNHVAWNGSAWNGAAWNGLAWNSDAWA
jgi:serine protease AprX